MEEGGGKGGWERGREAWEEGGRQVEPVVVNKVEREREHAGMRRGVEEGRKEVGGVVALA